MSGDRRLFVWALVAGVLIALLILLRGVLLPFVIGFAIAYFLDPAVDKLVAWRLPRLLATILLTLGFFVAIVAVLVLLVPLLNAQLVDFASRLPRYANLFLAQATAILEIAEARLSPEDLKQIQDAFAGIAGDAVRWVGRLLGSIWSGGVALANLLGLVVITPIVAFYLLLDWDRLVDHVDGWLPRQHAKDIRAQVSEIDRVLAGFARGQAAVCLLLGAFYGIGLTLVGLDFGLIVGIGTGLISFVPYFGMLTGFAVGIGLALAQFPDWMPVALVATVFVAGQVIEGNIITPKLVGERVGLHPVWMIFALLAGGALFGFLGILLAVPMAAGVGVVVRFALARYQAGSAYGADGAERQDPGHDR